MAHLTDDELASYATDPEQSPNRAEIEAHLDSCIDCRADLDVLQEPETLLADREFWTAQPPDGSTTEGQELEALRAIDLQKREEHESAQHLLRRPLRSPAAFAAYMGRLRSQRKYWIGGVVELLNGTAQEVCQEDAIFAKDLSDTAVEISKLLAADAKYSASRRNELLGSSWKAHANALRMNNEWSEAMNALDNAESAFRRVRDPILLLAQVDAVRAAVLVDDEKRRLDGLALARSAARVFKHFGQMEHHTLARHFEAAILFEMSELNAAEAIMQDELTYAEKSMKALWHARASQLLANIEQARGHSRIALGLAESAIPIFRDAGLTLEVLRTEWVLARATFGCGEEVAGLTKLRRVRAEFFRRELPAQAALVSLDLTECLSLARKTSEILGVAKDLVAELTKIGLTSASVAAANYLRDAATRNDVTPSLLDHLRRFFRRLVRTPELQFTPHLKNPG